MASDPGELLESQVYFEVKFFSPILTIVSLKEITEK